MLASCDLCGGASAQKLRQGFVWVVCNNCESIRFLRMGSEKFSYSRKTEKYSGNKRVQLRWGHQKGIDYIRKFDSHNLIEIGCNTGEFTEKLSRYARNVTGIDINADAIEAAIKRYPQVNFATVLPRDSSRKTVILIDCLEHFESIEDAFEKMCGMGNVEKFVISSPNVKKYLYDRTDYPPHHFYRFSITGLELFMKRRGYNLTKCEIEYSFDLFVFNLIGLCLNKKSEVYYGSGLSADANYIFRFFALVIRPILKIFNPFMRLARIPHSAFFIVFDKNA